MLQCYNRGCGQKFDPAKNNDESCLHHPGEPFFHDAYKGWTCCNKKSVDFTEFLNMTGCTLSKHSNVKPPEPVKQEKLVNYEEPVVEIVRKPIQITVERPSFDSNLTLAQPKVTPALKETIDALKPKPKIAEKTEISSLIETGTACKNGGCQLTYISPESALSECQYHPGTPIFHEGLKYWSCCQKRTSDFTAFMNQKGCKYGKHKWTKDNADSQIVDCRYDWHQTATNVIIAIYAKLYHYEKSTIKLNPVRLMVSLVFPEQNDAKFNLDLELRGVIKVDKTTVTMYPTKVEITMPKADPGAWSKLDFPRKKLPEANDLISKNIDDNDDSDSDVDLDDLEAINMGAKLVNVS